MIKPTPPRPEIAALLESLKGHVMSPLERFNQRFSFVWSGVTRREFEDKDRAAEEREVARRRFAKDSGFPLDELEELDRLRQVLGNIEYLRHEEGDSITVCCSDPDADSVDTQVAIDCEGFWTDFRNRRYYGRDVATALSNAVLDRKAYEAREAAERSK